MNSRAACALAVAALIAACDDASTDRAAVLAPRPAAIPGGGAAGVVDPPLSSMIDAPRADRASPRARSRPQPLAIGGALWRAVGPAAIRDGQTERVTPDDKVAGAVHVVVPHPSDRDRIWIGTVNGGVWETRNATATDPTWRPLTDRAASSSVSALELDPTDPQARTLLAGFGNVSSYGASGLLNGLLYTRDGGAHWRAFEDPLLVGTSVTGVAARGNVLVAATSSLFGTYAPGGVVRSTDRGQTWTRVASVPVIDTFDLAADPANPARLYVVTAGAVYRSDDTGGTWVDISSSDPRLPGLLADPSLSLAEIDVGAQGRLFLVATRFGNGEYIGYTDGGAWTEMDLPYTPESPTTPIVSVRADDFGYGVQIESPGHNLTTGLLVDVQGLDGVGVAPGVYIALAFEPDAFILYETALGSGSYEGGATWQLVNGTNPKSKSNGAPSPFGGVRRPGGQGSIHLSIAADPRDRHLVYIGGDRQDLNFGGEVLNFLGAENYSGRLFRGDTRAPRTRGVLSPQWRHLTHFDSVAAWPDGGTASGSSPHADSRDLEFDAAGDLIEGDDGGIYRRTAPRAAAGDWQSLVGDLQITELHNIAYDRVSRTVIGGAQDVGTPMSSPGTRLWSDFTQGDGGDVAVDDSTLAADGQSIRYTAFPGWPIAFRSTWDAAGELVDYVSPALAPLDGVNVIGSFTTPLELNANDPRRLVIGGRNGVFESLDQGETTTLVGPAIDGFQNAMAYGGFRAGQANADILYYGTGTTIMRRASAGELAAPTAAPFPGGQVRDVALSPRDHDTVYAIDADHAYVSRDGGASWRDITGDLDDTSLRSLVVVPIAPGIHAVVAGGLTGVSFTWSILGVVAPVWFRLGTNLPTAPVWDLDWDAADRVLTVGTLGRGAWQGSLSL